MNEQDTLYALLRDRVISAEFQPGQRLRAEILCRDYDCAPSTIRELLLRLSTVGLVVFQEQRGFRQPEVSREVQHDLTQFRIWLESMGARMSIRHGGVAWEARLSAAHHTLSHIESHVQNFEASEKLLSYWSKAEQGFHSTLIDACGSASLMATHADIYLRFRQQQINTDRKFLFLPENIKQHQGILDAALDHDEDLVSKRIHDHLARNLMQSLPDMQEIGV